MPIQTLEEVKAELAAEEAAAAAPAEPEAEEVEDEAEPTATEQTGEVEAETEHDDPGDEDANDGEEETEDWMQGDQGAQEADLKFGDSDVAAAKRKLRAKLEKKHTSEVDELQAKIAELEKRVSQPQQQSQSALQRPKRDDFLDADDPDEAFSEALVDWKLKTAQAEQQAESKTKEVQAKLQEVERKVKESVDQHYDRAAELAEKSGISPEQYQAADYRVRKMVHDIVSQRPNGNGDKAVDWIISKIGKGSEKVIYNLGVNTKRLAEFESILRSDTDGTDAVAFAVRLAAELQSPVKRKSNAPAPAPQVTGDAKGSDSAARLKKKYDQADGAKAFEIRRQAREQGIDVRNW